MCECAVFMMHARCVILPHIYVLGVRLQAITSANSPSQSLGDAKGKAGYHVEQHCWNR